MVVLDSLVASELLALPQRDVVAPTDGALPVALAKSVDHAAWPAASAPAPALSPSVAGQFAEPEPAAPRAGMVARFRRRLFNPLGDRSKPDAAGDAGLADQADAPSARRLAKTAPVRDIGFKASLAEFLLINRLRARIRPKAAQPAQSADVLQRGEQIIYVTCKDWFGDGDSHTSELGTRL